MNRSHPIGLLIGSEDVVLSITAFLSAKDCINLHAVSRAFHHCLSGRIDETLFEKHLRCDFDEGEVLVYVAEKKNLSYKKLYRAFRGRWSLPKQEDPNIQLQLPSSSKYENRYTKILIPWSKPSEKIPKEQYRGAKILVPNNDVDDVVFIASIGGDNDTHSALMDWNPECKSTPRGQLIIDKSWCDDKGTFVLPKAKVNYISEYKSPFALTLHAIDTKYYQVASLLDHTPMDKEDGCLRDRENYSKIDLYYGEDPPALFAIPPKGSPFHRVFTDRDFFECLNALEDGPPGLFHESIRGRLVLEEVEQNERLVDDDYSDEEDYEYEYDYEYKFRQEGMLFDFGEAFEISTVQWPHHLCSFFRALMREKCLHIESRGLGPVVVQQPRWVQDRKILDTVTSFLCFEDQAFKSRLVCRQFCNSAMRQLQAKLDKNKRIGLKSKAWQEPFEWEMFQATVRQGWSDNCLTNKEESAIDDALWLASCRCYLRRDYCEDRRSCKNTSMKYLECYGYSSTTGTTETQAIDKDIIRQKLRVKGSVCLTERDPKDRSYEYVERNKVECYFDEDEMNLFDLCRKLEEEILSGADDDDNDWTGMPASLHWKLQKDYGVVYPSSSSRFGYVTHKQFVRAIFLLFTRSFDEGEGTAAEDDAPKKKKARSTPSQKIAITMAKSNIELEDGQYSREKKIIRFNNSANNVPIEICIESMHYRRN